jgi:hypothetical protein
MATQRYSVTPYSIETILAWVKSDEIGIPEIQRPFVWEATKVRNLLDSLYQGYPVGYLIAWRNPTIKLKDGTRSAGKRILIDGQQRVTALMAAILGREVLSKDYEKIRIRIAFHPQDERFEVANPAIKKDTSWIPDIFEVFSPEASVLELTDNYCAQNPKADRRQISRVLENLRKIINNHVGIIELAEDLQIETVTEIFIRVNSAGKELQQADFAMSKIAVNEPYQGALLRKAIDYFCHACVSPDFIDTISDRDKAFGSSEFFDKIKWLKTTRDDLYDPTYSDMLRVAFTSEFGRGKLQDLVALLSGRNFETKQYEEHVAEDSFRRLKSGIHAFVNQTHFERFTMILRSAGFISSTLLGGQNAVNFAYILYLRGRAQKMNSDDLESLIRRWFAMSILTGRYTSNPETAFDFDIRKISEAGITEYANAVLENELPVSFWTGLLPQNMDTSSRQSPYFHAYQAAQVKLKDLGFLSRDISVSDLLLNRADVHHIYPKKHLSELGLSKGQYNQIANLCLTQSEINIRIGNTDPQVYFAQVMEQCSGGRKSYGGITDLERLKENYEMNCIPSYFLEGKVPQFDIFLEDRRKLLALRIQNWFESL